ncbi:hypothetical protein J6590_059135 [Homalodisca vitripennis]|nr:hypothetical protein J6590_059135 [Homalodisca vitripennis]
MNRNHVYKSGVQKNATFPENRQSYKPPQTWETKTCYTKHCSGYKAYKMRLVHELSEDDFDRIGLLSHFVLMETLMPSIPRNVTKSALSSYPSSNQQLISTICLACPRVFKQYFSKSLGRQKRMYRVVTKITRSNFTTLRGCINDLRDRIVAEIQKITCDPYSVAFQVSSTGSYIVKLFIAAHNKHVNTCVRVQQQLIVQPPSAVVDLAGICHRVTTTDTNINTNTTTIVEVNGRIMAHKHLQYLTADTGHARQINIGRELKTERSERVQTKKIACVTYSAISVMLLGWVTAERSWPCKQPAYSAIGCGTEVTFKPFVPRLTVRDGFLAVTSPGKTHFTFFLLMATDEKYLLR